MASVSVLFVTIALRARCVGRLLLFWQCLQEGLAPFLITEDLRFFYYRGIQNWGKINGYLKDTCLTAQDDFKIVLDYYRIKY